MSAIPQEARDEQFKSEQFVNKWLCGNRADGYPISEPIKRLMVRMVNSVVEQERIKYQQKHLEREREYILPAFRFADEVGIDLATLVREAKGNCNVRLWEAMRDLIRGLKEENRRLRLTQEEPLIRPDAAHEFGDDQ